MTRTHVRLVSLGLTTLYGVVAVLGYSLHSFVGCHDSACREAVCLDVATTQSEVTCEDPADSLVSEHTCCCHHHGSGGHAPQAKNDRPAIRLAKSSHDPSTCSICSLLAQLKTGYTAVEFAASSEQPTVELSLAYDSALYSSPIRLGDARGPPLQAA